MMNTFPNSNTVNTLDAEQTREQGAAFGAQLQKGDTVCLRGELGAGKTTWTQGVARALEIENAVSSPTFVLINEHQGRETLLHLDAYRLENADEETLRDAGVLDLLERENAIKIIEWPQRIADFLPPARYEVHIEVVSENERRITVAQLNSPANVSQTSSLSEAHTNL